MRAPFMLACLLSGFVACQQQPTPAADGGDKKSAPPATEPKVEPPPEKATEPEPAAPVCTNRLTALDEIDRLLAGKDAIDAAAASKLVSADALAWLAEADIALGRATENKPDDVALLEQTIAALPTRDEAGVRSDLALIATQLRAVAFLDMRRLLADVAERHVSGADAPAAWDRATCLWDGALRKLAKRVDALPVGGGEGWEGDIDEAFRDGRAAIAQGDAGMTVVMSSRQRIEKSIYFVAHRLVLADAEAHTTTDASEALGLLELLEDRLADRNGPGLERMRRAFAGDPAQIDVAAIERDLAIAFAKRARKYCDKAVTSNELATPVAVSETWEGVIYTRLNLPGMKAALGESFDADAYLEDWERYLDAVEAGDAAQAAEISPRLIEPNCAYQAKLGIAECTASANEEK